MKEEDAHHRDEPIRLVAYDATWPAKFSTEAASLRPVLEPWLSGPIEHIGSTAVPGLRAKPVVDIMAGVDGLGSSLAARGAVESMGYCYFPYRADVMHWFCKPSPWHRTHHLHLIPHGSRAWRDRLAFRDSLRRSAELAAEYAKLKAELASRFEFDRESYTENKSPFVRRVLRHAGSGEPPR